MANTNKRTTMNGREARMIFDIGFSKRRLEMKRLIPTGGVKAPIWRLARKMIPRWIGLIPYAVATGVMSGTTTIRAEKMSSKQPTTRRKRFRRIKNMKGLLV